MNATFHDPDIASEVIVSDEAEAWLMLSDLAAKLRTSASHLGGAERLQLARDFSRLARFELETVGSRESIAIRAFLTALEAAL